MMATKLKTVEDELNTLDNDTIHTAMARAFAEIEAATKSANNPHFKSKYADLTSVIEAIKPALVGNGLFFVQRCQPAEGGVCVETYVYHRGGGNLSLGTIYVPANKQDAQGYGSAITYARRYALQTGFGVPTEDDDGNAAARTTANPTTGEPSPTKREKLPDLVLKDRTVPAPYPFKTHLMEATRQFVKTLAGYGDLEEFKEWGETEEVQLFLKQLKRDLPGWWAGGADVPGDWVPVEILISQKKRDLEQVASLKERA